jgi:hypothetical protein
MSKSWGRRKSNRRIKANKKVREELKRKRKNQNIHHQRKQIKCL